MKAQEIKNKALQLGYLACRIIPTNVFDEFSQYLDERIKSFPSSKALYEPMYGFVRQPDIAKSIIVCILRYNKYTIPESLSKLFGKLYLFDSRINYSQEYRNKLEFDEFLKLQGINIVQAGVSARMAAAKAGLGKLGRNNFIYDPEHGSFIYIYTWIVDKELEYDPVEEDTLLSACNDGCQKCIQACPTTALSGSYSMDMGKCITHLTCFPGASVDNTIRAQMGLWLYGCDVCQDACPANKDKFKESEAFPLLHEQLDFFSPEHILEMDEDTYVNIVNPRYWYAGKENMWLWQCNALRSMINSKDAKYHALIDKYCDHTDERIRAVAQWGKDNR